MAKAALRKNWRIAEAAREGQSDEQLDEDIDREIHQIRVVRERRNTK